MNDRPWHVVRDLSGHLLVTQVCYRGDRERLVTSRATLAEARAALLVIVGAYPDEQSALEAVRSKPLPLPRSD